MSKAFWRSPQFVLVSAVGIILFAYGGRQSLGMFLRPITEALGFMTTNAQGQAVQNFEPMSFATALQVLIYGCAAPFVGAIADRVVAVGGAAVVRPMMTMTLSADHRVVDGAMAAAFLTDVVAAIRDPASWLSIA